jgi:hypothetical protein
MDQRSRQSCRASLAEIHYMPRCWVQLHAPKQVCYHLHRQRISILPQLPRPNVGLRAAPGRRGIMPIRTRSYSLMRTLNCLHQKMVRSFDLNTIKHGYSKDPWFTDPQFQSERSHLLHKNGLWYHWRCHSCSQVPQDCGHGSLESLTTLPMRDTWV